jgi:hypothetical protein
VEDVQVFGGGSGEGCLDDGAYIATVCRLDGAFDCFGSEVALVVFRFLPEEVSDQLIEERVPSGGFYCVADKVGGDLKGCLDEGAGEGLLHFPHCGGVEIDLVGPVEKCGHPFVEQVGHGSG